jgi:hypothetical protein
MAGHADVASSVVLVDSVKVLEYYWYIVPVSVQHRELLEIYT